MGTGKTNLENVRKIRKIFIFIEANLFWLVKNIYWLMIISKVSKVPLWRQIKFRTTNFQSQKGSIDVIWSVDLYTLHNCNFCHFAFTSRNHCSYQCYELLLLL